MTIFDLDEEVYLGRRAFYVSQEAWNLATVSRIQRFIDVGWYDTSVDPEAGPFALVQTGGELEDLIGEIVRVIRDDDHAVLVYVLGAADLSYEFALSRRAYLEIAVLAKETIPCVLEVVS